MWWHLVQSSTTPPFPSVASASSHPLCCFHLLFFIIMERSCLPCLCFLYCFWLILLFLGFIAEAKLNKTCVVLSKSDSRADHLQGVGHGCLPSSPSLSCCFIAKNILFLLFLSYFLVCIYCCKAGFYTSEVFTVFL